MRSKIDKDHCGYPMYNINIEYWVTRSNIPVVKTANDRYSSTSVGVNVPITNLKVVESLYNRNLVDSLRKQVSQENKRMKLER